MALNDFAPSSIFPEQEVQTIINQFFLSMATEQDDFFILLGSIQGGAMRDEIVSLLLTVWVKRADRKYKNIGRQSPYRQAYFSRRGCTFEEYRELFDPDHLEKHYRHYPAFEFFAIMDASERRKFTTNKTPNVESYIEDLSLAQLSALNFFF